MNDSPPQFVESESACDKAVEAVVRAHEDELRRYLAGEQPANQWRPEVYARAAIEAFLNEQLPRVEVVAREMLNLRGPAREATVHEWAQRLKGGC